MFREVAVIGLPNDEVGEAPTAFIVLREGVEASDEIRQEIIDLIKSEFVNNEVMNNSSLESCSFICAFFVLSRSIRCL